MDDKYRGENTYLAKDKIDLDEKMAEALSEERLARAAKARARHRKRRRQRIILAFIILVLLAVGAYFAYEYFSSDVYKNEEEFKEFADFNIKRNELSAVSETAVTTYSYDKEKSVAIRTDAIPYEGADTHIISKIANKDIEGKQGGRDSEEAKSEAEKADSKQNANQQSDDKQGAAEEIGAEKLDSKGYDVVARYCEYKIDGILSRYENKNGAVLIDSAIYETSNGAYSLVLHAQLYQEKDKAMVFKEAQAETYLFNAETGRIAEPIFILQPHYRKAVSAYAIEAIPRMYEKNSLVEGWEQQLSEEDINFNKFIMAGDNIIFLFEPGSIMPKMKGVITMPITYNAIGSYIRPKIIERYIDPDRPMVALTYDDGPGEESEKRILHTLANNNAVATFFYVGYRVSLFEETAKEAVTIGCEIGNHTWDHPQLSKLGKKDIIRQISRTNREIEKYCHVTPDIARPPYGDYDESVLEESGMAQVLWTVDTLDWKHRDPKKTFKAVKKTKKLDGKIILMHSIHDETADATEKIVPWLKKRGYQMVTVSELIKYKTGESPKAGEIYR